MVERTLEKPTAGNSPADLGFYMPAEWQRHERCWMAWPCRAEVWGDRLEGTKRGYAAVAKAISAFEPVTMLVRPEDAKQARSMLAENIDILEMPIDDSWTRDSGPSFDVPDAGPGADGSSPDEDDTRAPQDVCSSAGSPVSAVGRWSANPNLAVPESVVKSGPGRT